MLTPSARGAGSRPYGALLLAGGALALLAYFALREGPSNTASAAAPSARSARAHPTAEEADDVELPAEPRPRPARARAGGPQKKTAQGAEQKPEPALSPEDAASPAVRAVLEARDDLTPSGTRTLISSLTSEDEIVVAEAARALIARGATEAIEPLARIDLSRAAGSGLSIIDALGKLAAVASEADRGVAVDRLVAMLAEEKRRGARESAGNLIQIYEALGQTGDPRAAAPLEAELLDADVPRAPKVVIVASLVQLEQRSSRSALETALATESAAKGDDAFEEEVRVELVGALEAALKVL
ncbi:MAG: hypothetical protein JNL21_15270 [Myxococcales bacterium]|nr:hypothetical protein [Myxococcales bacterium]